jgi:hypothetical protein
MKTDATKPEKTETDGGTSPVEEDAGTFDRSFKYAIIIYAVVEFIAIALVLYYKFAR